jgi:Flp pilus assembly protein TadG
MRFRPGKSAMRGIGLWRALWRDRHGGSPAVEMGLVAPALFMFLLGIAWFGYAFWLQNALDFAVTKAARCASLGSCADPASYAADQSGAGFDSTVFTLTSNTNCSGATQNGNQVSGTYAVAMAIPFVPITLNLSSCAFYPK